jgi:3-oxoacyl-[acyl-carrier protein] reductase
MLKDKVAIVTGSSSGIGKEIALSYARNGAKVVLNYARESSKVLADEVLEEITSMGQEAICIRADVSSFEESKYLIDETIKAFGRIDILVNNAGITKDMLLLRMTEEEFQSVLDVNLKSVFNCTKHATRTMLKTGGSIINVTSVVGLMGNAGQCNYAAAKAGMIGFTKSAAREFAGKNIRVNAIAPGFIVSSMTEKLSDQIKEGMLKNIPFARFGKAGEVAGVALFLASELSSYVTGEVIRVDGGLAM